MESLGFRTESKTPYLSDATKVPAERFQVSVQFPPRDGVS
jgi:hypothetical protein